MTLVDRQSIRDYAELHFIVFIWGFTAILGVLISVEPASLVVWRTLIAGVVLIFLLKIKNTSYQVSNRDLIVLILTGGIIALHWITFFLSARLSNISVCLAGLSTVALWTSFIEPLIYKRPLRMFEVFLSALVIAGIYAIYYFQGNYWLGLLVGIFSAILSALFSVINSRLVKSIDAYKITLYEMWGACLFSSLYLLIFSTTTFSQSLSLNNLDPLWLLILSILCTVYPFAASTALMKRLSAYAVNLTVNLEPVYGILLAILIFNENKDLNVGFYFGTALILFSVILYPFLNKRYSPLNTKA